MLAWGHLSGKSDRSEHLFIPERRCPVNAIEHNPGCHSRHRLHIHTSICDLHPSDNYTEAESCFHQAIAIARNQSAKSWELRAATSLAKLWQRQGKRQEAYDLLAPVYGWFTEGFDTADLQDAKALLDELEDGRS
jgi:hypothetical protein